MKRAAFFAVLVACHAPTEDPSPAVPDTSAGPETAPIPVTGEGLPCNIRSLLETYCTDCHAAGAAPSGGVALTSYDALVAPSPVDPKQTVAQRCVARMNDAARPMPPPALLDANAKATFEAWVADGAKATVCGASAQAAPAPAPTSSASPVNAPAPSSSTAPPPAAPPPVSICTSGQIERTRDRPGSRCIQCHAARGGPLFSVAGTLYPTLREPTGCVASTGGAIVEITDAKGVVRSITVGPDGNFATRAPLEAPYSVRVLSGGKERKMIQDVFQGDCNGCHTEDGLQGAPGRVALP